MLEIDFKRIVSHCKEYGFVFQSSEIYDGLSATYDYGHNGVELKNNIKKYWWDSMTKLNENIVGIDSAIFMHPTTWKASGHVDAFNDPLIDNKDSKKRYRADVLLEEYLSKIESKIAKEIEKAKRKFGENFDEKKFIETNPNVVRENNKKNEVESKISSALNSDDLNDIKSLIEDLGIVCPISGTANWTDVRQFNLMFNTQLGSLASESNTIYLRPETAQGIFVNYLNIQKTARKNLPFGIAQIGKAFRNEIIARQFIFRMREFEQMEMQFFIKPGTQKEWFEKWKENRIKWHKNLGFEDNLYRFHDHTKLAHYADAATDIEFNYPIGYKELEGIHSRTDFDLKSHEKFSGKKIQFYDNNDKQSYVPYVIETSIGLDRMFLAIISASLKDQELDKGNIRTVMKIPIELAPVKLGIFPLQKENELCDLSMKIFNNLKFDHNCAYEENDSIGKRYRRQDAIGTPYCITIDHQSIQDNTVTLRHRDTMLQERININQLELIIKQKVDMNNLLKNL